MLKGISPVSILLLTGILVMGAFVGMWSYLTIDMSGDIEADGNTEYAIYWDGSILSAQENVISMDIDYIAAADLIDVTHTIESHENDGDWDLTFDLSAMETWINIHDGDPGDDNPYAGFYFHVYDNDDNDVTDGIIPVMAGYGMQTLKFSYELDPHFKPLEIDDRIPFSLILRLDPHANMAPAISDWSLTKDTGPGQTVTVLEHVTDLEGDDIDITDVSVQPGKESEAIISGTYPNEYLTCMFSAADGGSVWIDITVSDGEFSDTGRLSVTINP